MVNGDGTGASQTTAKTGSSWSAGGDWAGALVSSGFGILNSYLSDKRSQEYYKENLSLSNQYQIASELRNLDYQKRLQQQQLDLENQYNSPAAQMARYRAAGLNANLLAGNPTSTYDVSAGSASAAAPSAPMYQSKGLGVDAATQYQIYMGMEQLQMQRELNKAQIANIEEDTTGKAIDNLNKDDLQKLEITNKELTNARQLIENDRAQIAKSIEEATQGFQIDLKEIERNESRNSHQFNVEERAHNINMFADQEKIVKEQALQSGIDTACKQIGLDTEKVSKFLFRILAPQTDRFVKLAGNTVKFTGVDQFIDFISDFLSSSTWLDAVLGE